MNMWWSFLLIFPAMALAYTPPTKAPSAQAVQKTQLGYGGYGSIMGVEGTQVNYGLPKTNLPAPNMSYGSIKRPPSEPEVSVAPSPAPKPQPPVPKPESTNEHHLPETNYATGDHLKPVDQGKETHAQLPPSYGGYGSIMDKQPAVVDQNKVSEPLAPPPPMGYGSLVQASRETHAVKDETEKHVAPVVEPSPAPETPTPVQAPAPTAKGQLSGSYAEPPPVKPQELKPPASEDAESSGSSQSHQVPPMPSYGSYGYLPLNRPSAPKVSMDQVVPKEKAVAATTATPVEQTEAAEPETEAPKSDVAQQPTDLSDNDIREGPAAPAPGPMPPKACENKSQYCDYWRETGECEKNPAYMKVNCAVSCGTCVAA